MTETKIPNFDAIFCGKQPLHNTNHIQSHGVLLVLEKSNLQVVQTSENVAQLVSLTREEIVGKPVKNIITGESYHLFQSAVLSLRFKTKVPLELTFIVDGSRKEYLTLIHEKDDLLMVEIEFADAIENKSSFINVFQQVKQVMTAVDAATTVNEVCHIAALEIKKISGFDKVMIYTFDEDWNGTVLAEAMEKNMDSYLGLKFPASDIPKPARDLYFKNPFRLIPDCNYEPVPLSPYVNPVTNTASDLTDCKLRSVARVHIEYLRNMGIVASMSTRIIHREKLWGLISCHHRNAKFLSFEETSVFELLSNALSARLSSILNKRSSDRTEELNNYFNTILQQTALFDDLVKMLVYKSEILLKLLSAEGVAICWNGKIEIVGLAPEERDIAELQQWLLQKKIKQTLHLPALSFAYTKAELYAEMAGGLVVLPIEPETGNCILAFRPEAIQQVKWGGNPNEAITFEKNSAQYHPRNSFQVWKETVKGNSVAWSADELAIIERFRNFLVEYSLERRNRDLESAIKEFTFMANLIPQLVWTARADGFVDFFNDRWYSYSGLSVEQSLGSGWKAALHPDDLEKTVQVWEQSVNKKMNYEIEYRLLNNDGTYSWFLGRAFPLTDSSRDVIKWFGTCTKIEDQKKMEKTLEQKVLERTVELTALNNQLEQSNSDLRQYAFVTSHDLQEPVRKIQVFGNLLKEKYLHKNERKSEEYLDKILLSSARMKNLITDLLAYSSVSNKINWQSTDLNVVLGDVLNDLELLVEEKKARIDFHKLPTIISQEGQMRQVFQNLLQNALHYTFVGRPPEISISSRFLPTADFDALTVAEGPFTEIVIKDNGIGFDQKYAEKIFQIFQRLQPRGNLSGTGIGLSIVKRIIDQHNGVIKATGVENEGATFTFILPVQPVRLPNI